MSRTPIAAARRFTEGASILAALSTGFLVECERVDYEAGTEGVADASVLVPVFADEFCGHRLDPAKWALHGNGTYVVDIRNGRMHLYAAASEDTPSDAEPTAILPTLVEDARLEATLALPGGADEFFYTFGLRVPVTLESAYMVVFFRKAGGTPAWRLQKYVNGKNTRMSRDIRLDDDERRYRLRLDVVGNSIRAVVRPYSAGRMPDGAWDLMANDSDLTAPGTARPHLTKRAGQGDAHAYVDDFRVFSIMPAS